MPRPKSAAPKPATKHAGGRPKNKIPPAPVTGFRIPLDVIADLDAVVADLSTGAVTASRTSVTVEALRAFIARHRAERTTAQ